MDIIRFKCCEHCEECGGTMYCRIGHTAPCFTDCVKGSTKYVVVAILAT